MAKGWSGNFPPRLGKPLVGQGGTTVGPSAWVTNSPLGGSASYPIDGTGDVYIPVSFS
jgi:hypothetical protein